MAEERTVRIGARLNAVALLASVVREEGEAAGLSRDQIIDLELAVVEAANNIVVHGYCGSKGEIEMRALRGDGLEVELIDSGHAIPSSLLESPPAAGLDAERGRGIGIIRSCVDRLNYTVSKDANRLRLFKARG